MKLQDITVTCIYNESSKDIQEIIIGSFAVFLQKELEGFQKHRRHDI